jgi:glycosyltransferase involved in cell wall biosynthesis
MALACRDAVSAMPLDPPPAAPGGLPSVLHALAPGPAGGLESVVQLLARGWVERGGRVALSLTLDQGTRLAPEFLALEKAGVTLFCHELPPRAYLDERARIHAVLERHRPDVVHTHGYRADLLAGWAARRAGIARVSTLHGFTGGDWKNRLYERIQLRALRRFDAVIAVSQPIASRLAGLGIPEDRVALIPNGWAPHQTPLPRAEARAALGLPAEGRFVGWVGRLSPEKGADVFLAALARLGRADVGAVVLGEGRLRAPLEAEARALGLGGRVRWLGLVPGAGRLAAAFDLFVLSSRTEGTPIALFEAMAAGTPIVATRVGGVPDVLRDGQDALLVPPEDPGALAAAMATALDKPGDTAARVEAAGTRLAEHYAIGPWLERHRALYHSLLARRERAVS